MKSVVDSERAMLIRFRAEDARPQPSFDNKRSSTKEHVPTALGHAEIDFIPLVLERTDRKASNSSFELYGLMSCGARMDLVWGASDTKAVFLMETKGHLRKIFEADRRHACGQAAFDGQYVWLPVTGPESRVLAINPATGAVVQFTSDDGYAHGAQ